MTTAQEKEDKQNINNNKPANKPSSSQKEFNNSNKNENTGKAYYKTETSDYNYCSYCDSKALTLKISVIGRIVR